MRTLILVLLVTAGTACVRTVYRPVLHDPRDVPSPTAGRGGLQLHLWSGELIVLDDWIETDSGLAGQGTSYDTGRNRIGHGHYTVPFDSIALLENEVRTGTRGSGVVGMAVWSVVWGAVTIACVVDPKSCFGSCPTFYVPSDNGPVLAAEGFSGSVARVLEARDVDALGPARAGGGPFTITMRNEALETHAIRSVHLLALPRGEHERVLAGPGGRFYPASTISPPTACRADGGDCRGALRALDGTERSVPADSHDLAATETLHLEFPAAHGRPGLVLGARHSLLSTFLFYQTMGFLGRDAGTTLAALERGGPEAAARAMSMARAVGRILIEVWDGEAWVEAGVHEEAGPLATDVVVFPLNVRSDTPLQVRLTLTRGAWRLDWVGMGSLGEPVEPVVLEPRALAYAGRPAPDALARLRSADRYLVTYPGDVYDLSFELPAADAGWELLLASQGYYYEWMRGEWLADEDPVLAALALGDPARALRMLAPEFKQAEPEMDRLFWSSRFRR